jgi:hypothetical protein
MHAASEKFDPRTENVFKYLQVNFWSWALTNWQKRMRWDHVCMCCSP